MMTTEQAMKAIGSHLEPYMKHVPQKLLNNIEKIINSTRTILKKEIILKEMILENRLEESPNLEKEWQRICDIYKADPITTKKGRQQDKIRVKVHFIRHVLLRYKYITLVELGRFLNLDHTSIISLRDRSKVECPIAPFFQKKRVIITVPEFHE